MGLLKQLLSLIIIFNLFDYSFSLICLQEMRRQLRMVTAAAQVPIDPSTVSTHPYLSVLAPGQITSPWQSINDSSMIRFFQTSQLVPPRLKEIQSLTGSAQHQRHTSGSSQQQHSA